MVTKQGPTCSLALSNAGHVHQVNETRHRRAVEGPVGASEKGVILGNLFAGSRQVEVALLSQVSRPSEGLFVIDHETSDLRCTGDTGLVPVGHQHAEGTQLGMFLNWGRSSGFTHARRRLVNISSVGLML